MFQDCHFLSNLTKQLQVKQKSNMMHKLKQTSNISTSYLGSLFVGQYNLDDMLSYFHTMIEKLNLDVESFLCLGMNGPNVYKCFQKKLGKELKLKRKRLISVEAYPLHIVSKLVLEGLKSIFPDIYLNQFA